MAMDVHRTNITTTKVILKNNIIMIFMNIDLFIKSGLFLGLLFC